MPFYQTKGEVPKKRHTIFKNPAGGIYYEELVSSDEVFFTGTAVLP